MLLLLRHGCCPYIAQDAFKVYISSSHLNAQCSWIKRPSFYFKKNFILSLFSINLFRFNIPFNFWKRIREIVGIIKGGTSDAVGCGALFFRSCCSGQRVIIFGCLAPNKTEINEPVSLQVGLYIRFKSYKVIVSLYREKKRKKRWWI